MSEQGPLLKLIVFLQFVLILFAGSALAQDMESGGPTQLKSQKRPVITDITLDFNEAIVQLEIFFTVLPKKYFAYALKNTDRIIVDCFETSLGADIFQKNYPRPIQSAELEAISQGGSLTLTRLTLFTESAVPYRIVEGKNSLKIIITWTRRSKTEEITKKSNRRFYLLTGAAIITTGLVSYLIFGNDGAVVPPDTGSGPAEIPFDPPEPPP